MDLYREEILDHNKNPSNFGELKGADVKASKANISCGDSIEVFVELGKNKEGKVLIKKMKFMGVGCALSIAAASMLTEKVEGKEIDNIGKMNKDFIIKMIGVEISAGRIKCVLLPLEALKIALKI